jgi:hypothetical protein
LEKNLTIIDSLLRTRHHLPFDERFLCIETLTTIPFTHPELLRENPIDLRVVCTAEVSNEIFILPDAAYIVIDLATIETAFHFVMGCLRYGVGSVADPTKCSILRLAMIRSLGFDDPALTAAFLVDYVSERCRLEAVLSPKGLVIDADSAAERLVKNALAAFAVGHEIAHFLYRRSKTYREERNNHLDYVLKHTIDAIVGANVANPLALNYLRRLEQSLNGSAKTATLALDLEEVTCDMVAACSVLNAISKASQDFDAVRIAFTAIQMSISVNWLIGYIDLLLGRIIFRNPLPMVRNHEIISGRSLITASYASGYRLRMLEDSGQSSDINIQRVLADLPNADALLVSCLNELFSFAAMLRREHLGQAFIDFKLGPTDSLFDAVIRVLRGTAPA